MRQIVAEAEIKKAGITPGSTISKTNDQYASLQMNLILIRRISSSV